MSKDNAERKGRTNYSDGEGVCLDDKTRDVVVIQKVEGFGMHEGEVEDGKADPTPYSKGDETTGARHEQRVGWRDPP